MSNASLYHALTHHAKALEPLVLVLALGYAVELQPRGWNVRHSGKGASSYSLQRDGKQFHFRYSRNPWEIIVKDAWFHGKEVGRLRTRTDVLRFIERVKAL